jgi:uncharacterized protein
MLNIPQLLADELSLQFFQVSNALQLQAEGGTVPFIARYRKERTGEMNEIQLRDLFDRFAYMTELDERKLAILRSIDEQGKMTEELRSAIERCPQKNELEDLYLPYKPKKRTRATIAREKGLEPLAAFLKQQNDPGAGVFDCERAAMAYVSGDLGVTSPEEALAGAADILAEEVAEKAVLRAFLRDYFLTEGLIVSSIAKEFSAGTTKYEMYRDYKVRVKEIQPHNMLALRRGEKEGVLAFDVTIDGAFVQSYLESQEIRTSFPELRAFYRSMLSDAFERLMRPALVGEVRLTKKEFSDHESIRTFESNLRELLLASPAGMKPTLGIDPGFRSGCKIVAIDNTGKFLEYQAIFPHQSESQRAKAAATLAGMITRHGIELIAIGNGTAGRETERFVGEAVASLERKPIKVMVSESGASVYSASRVAIDEFPDIDVTVRGAISIGRRLQDPLAELVKIDPKSIGVGQYQHDVDQRLLKKKLEETVESCVNYVGVDVNTASQELLRYVAGVNSSIAKNIVAYRNENGPFASRGDLHNVPKFGPKTFEQAAGFLRIRGGTNPLDNSAVHPESYPIVERMVQDLGVRLSELTTAAGCLRSIDLKRYATETVGEPTLRDLVAELEKPGRDPRAQFTTASFREGINEIQDLAPGMTLEGVVTNVANFGAFVDIGVHQDGLVHVSQLADRFVKDPTAVVKVGQIVTVRVLEVNASLKRISLTMKSGVVQKQTVKRFTVDDLKAKFNSR